MMIFFQTSPYVVLLAPHVVVILDPLVPTNVAIPQTWGIRMKHDYYTSRACRHVRQHALEVSRQLVTEVWQVNLLQSMRVAQRGTEIISARREYPSLPGESKSHVASQSFNVTCKALASRVK